MPSSYHMKYRAAIYYKIIIPPLIMGDSRLFWHDKLIYGFFLGTMEADGYSHKYTWDIGHCLDLSEKKIWSGIARLKKYKLIERKYDHGYGKIKYYNTRPLILDLNPTEVDMSAFDPLIDSQNFNFNRDLEEYNQRDK